MKQILFYIFYEHIYMGVSHVTTMHLSLRLNIRWSKNQKKTNKLMRANDSDNNNDIIKLKILEAKKKKKTKKWGTLKSSLEECKEGKIYKKKNNNNSNNKNNSTNKNIIIPSTPLTLIKHPKRQ